MSSVLTLGIRLAWGSKEQRLRSVAVAVATALGVAALLLVWSVARDRLVGAGAYSSEVGVVIAGTVAMVALPVVAMVATVAKLQIREREVTLANLRRLGLSATRTRLVAGVEVGIASVTGVLLGVPLFALLLALVQRIDVAGQPWNPGLLAVPLWGWAAVLVGVPAVAVVVAAWPPTESSERGVDPGVEPAAATRGAGLWRLLPLLVGLAACTWAMRRPSDGFVSDAQAYVVMAGVALAVLGLLLAAPVLVGLVADLGVRVARSPEATIAARRLQARPGAVLRVVATLMAVLAVLAGAPGVLAAFEDVAQYGEGERNLSRGQAAEVPVAASAAAATVARLEGAQGIEDVVDLPVVMVGVEGQDPDDEALLGVVATCADLTAVGAEVDGCVDDRVLMGDFRADLLAARSGRATPVRFDGEQPADVSAPLDLSAAVRVPSGELYDWRVAGGVDLVVPPSTPGMADLVAVTGHRLIVLAPPGRDLMSALDRAGVGGFSMNDSQDYDFTQGLFFLARLIAALLLLLGTFTLTVAMVDRACAHRQQDASLRKLGTAPGVLRRAQGLEALVPLLIGGVSAVLVGWFGGNTWLTLTGEEIDPAGLPWALLLGCVVASLVVAGVTMLGGRRGWRQVARS
ncbi:hypothetical protein [Nocardioides jishulii]|uniref:FtsX-like permease family protein n=1 Tax=Nocardioides jishulii TaxID=2575440 RepID=A0A4U2YTN5_9ACTN|nr:hypothetical protein [Nocardioides jishulii]QCX28878.1 hypothetical protein FCL41_16120 [Nocardioides jishulii]TKI64225.1 hypothetical protein FC770_03445 [Nocardioides jishulii]